MELLQQDGVYSNSVWPCTLGQGRAVFHPAHCFLSLWLCQQQGQEQNPSLPLGTTGCSHSPSKAAVPGSHSITGPLSDANTLAHVVKCSVPRLAKG